MHAARQKDAQIALEEAIPALHARGDLEAEARAMNNLTVVLSRRADVRSTQLPLEALALLEPLPPGAALVETLTEVASSEMIQGRNTSAISYADQALKLAEQLGLALPGRALGARGGARGELAAGDGIEDMREAITLATAAGQGREVGILHNNLAIQLWGCQGPQAAIAELEAAISYATARGLAEVAQTASATLLGPLVDTGRSDDALRLAASLAPLLAEDRSTLLEVHGVEARIHVQRGDAATASINLTSMAKTLREDGNSDSIVQALSTLAVVHAALGDHERAAAAIGEFVTTEDIDGTEYYAINLPAMVRTAITVGRTDLAGALLAGYQPRYPYADHALAASVPAVAAAAGEFDAAIEGYADAVIRWERFGVVTEHAYALLGHGRCLLAAGRPGEATPILHQARAAFGARAAPSVLEIDELLKAAVARSS